jgi:hypothetical protein
LRSVELKSIKLLNPGEDDEGRLVFVDGLLAAVLCRLSGGHYPEDLRGRWFLEAGFGPLATNTYPTFSSLDEVESWVERALAEGGGSLGKNADVRR